jgi:2-amino-4-hydroxy-6-hydroxymethyldihydropteridine diphosphokinase
MLAASGIGIKAVSPFYETAPVPLSDQPWFVNAVVRIETALPPEALLAQLQAVETALGRRRAERNAARIIDLDLLVYGDKCHPDGSALNLPHPRMHERAFVLLPLRDLAPNWRHPESGKGINELIANLKTDQAAWRLLDAGPETNRRAT